MTPFTKTNFLKAGLKYSFLRSDVYFSPFQIHWRDPSAETTAIHDWLTQCLLLCPSFSGLFLQTPGLRKVSSWMLPATSHPSYTGVKWRAQAESWEVYRGCTSTAPSVMLELQLGDFFLSPAATMSPWDPQSSLFNTGLCLKLLCYVLVFIHSSSPSSSYIHVHQTNAGLLFRLKSVQF